MSGDPPKDDDFDVEGFFRSRMVREAGFEEEQAFFDQNDDPLLSPTYLKATQEYRAEHPTSYYELKANGHFQFDNGEAKAPPVEAFETIRASSWAGVEVPEQKWLEGRQIIPIGNVTLVTGSGGVGKTTHVLQLLAGCAIRGAWLGYPVNQDGRGTALLYSGEEPPHVIHRHLDNICRRDNIDMASLANLHIIDTVDEPGLFTTPKGKTGVVEPTSNYWRLKATVELVKPDIIAVDNRGQILEGDENSRVIAHQTMTGLIRLARHNDCAVMLLAHPSMSGTDSGLSGSTAWYAAARAQLNITRPVDPQSGKEDTAALERVIEVKKNQYGKQGGLINTIWDDGIYRCTDAAFQRAGFDIGAQDRMERLFWKLLMLHNSQKIRVSAEPRAKQMYAPALFSIHPQGERKPVKAYKLAMEALLAKGTIEQVNYGYKSRGTLHLIVSGNCNF